MRSPLKKFPHFQALDLMDCGPTCLRIIAKHYGRTFSPILLRKLSYKTKTGVSMLHLSDAADHLGFRTLGVQCSFQTLIEEKPFPFVAHWNQKHYLVVYHISKRKVYVSDPAAGLITFTHEEFRRGWCSTISDGEEEGIALLFEPTPKFYEEEENERESEGQRWKFYLSYLKPHRRLIGQLLIGLALASVFSLVTPLLTQALVDQGIQNGRMDFVYGILIAQLMIFIGSISISVIRSWVMLHMSTRINISIVSDFLVKLMKLPIGFFERKNLGDILQRMRDHNRIEAFLTSQSLSTVFSVFMMIVYSVILLIYSPYIFTIFFLASIAYLVWISLFLKKRRELDYKNFDQLSADQNKTVELIQGMQEIKLQSCEKPRRWQWERIQIRLFRLNIKSLMLEQFQGTGGAFINQAKNIFVSFWAAKEVIDGNMTLGMMMAVTQILGQLDGPLLQLVNFVRQAQDAKISLERLGEVHERKEEEEPDIATKGSLIIPEQQPIHFKNVYFRYDDPLAPWVLEDITLTIPYGKTTAIVGESGSGKTTLLKLILRFYEAEEGGILLGQVPLKQISARRWRKKCGVVMQDGYLFSDTIAHNIAVNTEEEVDLEKLVQAADTANARGFIEALPLNYNTQVGAEGQNLSVGQQQRLLIARAVYKNPSFLLLDEASSALDARNEKEITQKINRFNADRTAVIIAHRLSTVRKADNIVVLDKGKIVEQGTHEELTALKGLYYELVKEQLELSK